MFHYIIFHIHIVPFQSFFLQSINMKTCVVFLLIWVLTNSTTTSTDVCVQSETPDKLSFALSSLAQELQYFATAQQNKNNLYKDAVIAKQYLSELRSQMSQYNNVIIGQNNSVNGSKNVIVGSYNSITGSNNFAFVQSYTGEANGDLLLEQWRIDLTNVQLILVNPSLAISFLNEQQNRDYLTLLTNNRVSSGYGSNITPNNIFKYIRIDDQPINPKTVLNTQQVSSSVASSTVSSLQSSQTTNSGTASASGSSSSQTSNSGVSQTINSEKPASTNNLGNRNSNEQQFSANSGSIGTVNNRVNTNSGTIASSSSSNSNSAQINQFIAPVGSNYFIPPSNTNRAESANKLISNSGIPPTLQHFNSLFRINARSPRSSYVPDQDRFTNYNTGNNPGALVANKIISSIKQANNGTYGGNLRINF